MPANLPMTLHSHFHLRPLLTTRETPVLVPADVPGLIRVAQQQGVAPYLYWQLNALHVPLDAPEWELLHATYRAQVSRYQTFSDAAEKIDAVLERANIPSVWLKGLALAHSVYPEPALRPMRDLDVLVPFEQRRAAVEAIQASIQNSLPPMTWHGSGRKRVRLKSERVRLPCLRRKHRSCI